MDPNTVLIKVGGELTIHTSDLPSMALESIKAGLTVANDERQKAAELRQHGWWDMAETIALYRIEKRRGGDEVLCLPRGFVMSLLWILQQQGLPVQIEDGRTRAAAAEGYYHPFTMRDYQLRAALRLLEVEQGIWKCPAGGGKTVGGLGAIAWSGQRALIIVDKAGLANQWRVRASQFFGFPISKDDEGHDVAVLTPGAGDAREAGLIGNGVWEERDLTICLRQTLHERAWQLDATGWWQTWGWTSFDEGHHLGAETLAEICRKVTSHYLNAFSATPFKSETKTAIVQALVGPIIVETERQELYDANVLMKPTIEVLSGNFFAAFHPDHASDGAGNCEAEGCRKRGKHSHRNNYSSVLKKLVEDEERNKRIAARIMRDRGAVHLVPSSQLKHLNLIRRALIDAGWPEEKIWFLRGEENAKGLDQKIVQEVSASDEAIILSTVAGEGLDIPPIRRVHICFPMKDQGATIQLVGRGERISPGKIDSIVIDYREPRTNVFDWQFDERERTYRMQGYDIVASPYSVQLEEAPAADVA